MEIHYDLNGCHGTLRCTERSNLPSLWGALLVGAILAVGLAAVVVFGPMGIIPAVLMGTMLLAGGGGSYQDRLGRTQFSVEAAEAEEPALNWVFAKRRIARPFRVEGHLLTFDAQGGERLVDLRGADIRASSSGVFVDPSSDEPLELYWDDAVLADAERLADALRGIRDRELGDQADVPAELLNARQAQHT